MPLTAKPDCCEEAAIMPAGLDGYFPCNKPATVVVGWKGRSDTPIRMCAACADHNVKNRGGEVLRPHIALTSGEFYWLRGIPGARCFIAEYQAENQDRQGRPAGPCFWSAFGEVPGKPEVVAHIRRPQ